MAVEPISFSKLLKKTDDIYEAVVVSSKRAKQMLQDRIVKQMIDENEEISEEGILAEPVVRENIDFDKFMYFSIFSHYGGFFIYTTSEKGDSISLEHSF